MVRFTIRGRLGPVARNLAGGLHSGGMLAWLGAGVLFGVFALLLSGSGVGVLIGVGGGLFIAIGLGVVSVTVRALAAPVDPAEMVRRGHVDAGVVGRLVRRLAGHGGWRRGDVDAVRR